MLWIRRALMAIGVLLVALFMIVAVLENQQTTHLELFGLSSRNSLLSSISPWDSSWVVLSVCWSVSLFSLVSISSSGLREMICLAFAMGWIPDSLLLDSPRSRACPGLVRSWHIPRLLDRRRELLEGCAI